ncbi:MAG: HAD-IIA family hydrolase [Ruminococcaceae bacterium]|nr:HAD-IIA family hydrolase [Oscillospiraceae bacterium]
MSELKNKKLFLLDMDGTIYLDNNLFDGTIDFLSYVKKVGGRYIFLTNNSSKGVDKYIEKLEKMGIVSTADDFLTSTDATIIYLKEKGYKKIYAFGTESFVKQLKSMGLNVTTEREEGIDCLCLSNDTELTFKKLDDACILLRENIDYIATNPDWVCPTWYGFVPDCGSFADIIFNATKKRPKFIGKPEPEMAYLAMQNAGFSREETVLLGDRLYTDIACGINAGISTIFVLSGEGTLEDVEKSDFKPEFIYDNIRCIYKDLVK